MRARPIAMGCMRLSSEDSAEGAATLQAALRAGVTWFDTADVYAPSAEALGHNERLLAAAGVTAAPGVTVVSKGGLVRQGDRWTPDGRAAQLRAAAASSTTRLGRRPDLYLLHAVDRKVKLATSVRALADLAAQGAVGGVGLSNVGRAQLEEALAIASIAAVEVELHPWELSAVRGGLVALCEERGIWLLAHRPLGGVARRELRRRHPQLTALAAAAGCTAEELVLAWLASLSPRVVPLPGPTSAAHADSIVRAAGLALDDGMAREVARAFGLWSVRVARGAEMEPASASPALPALDVGEVVLVMGMPASGKTTRARHYEALGYQRLNRDDRGGSLASLAKALDAQLAAGARRLVLDNTYARRADRGLIIEIAARYGVPVACEHVSISIEQAQHHAVQRMLAAHGRLLEPDELVSKSGKTDPSTIPPRALFAWQRDLEPPALDEGFASLRELAAAPLASRGGAPALLLELDELVWRGKPQRPSQVELVPGALEALARWRAAGWTLAGTLWRPQAPTPREGGEPSVEPTELFAALASLLQLPLSTPFPVAVCRHPAGPPVCWCRKPLPGMALSLSRSAHLDLTASWHLGRGPADRGFAARAGCGYLDASAGLATLVVPSPLTSAPPPLAPPIT